MSVATAETGVTHEPTIPEQTSDGVAPRGVALSVALHLVLGTVFILGLPRLFAPPIPEELPLAVQLVTIAYHSANDDIRPKTLSSMIRQSGLPKRVFRP